MKPNGGPAFPIAAVLPQSLSFPGGGMSIPYQPGHSGISLRDYFAAAALQGFCAAPSDAVHVIGDDDKEIDHAFAPVWAEMAYEYADAMLAEREKE